MGKVSIFLHRSIQEYLDHLKDNILETSRSETVETMLRYIFDNDLENEVWENYDELLADFEEKVKDYEEKMAPVWEKEDGSEEEEEEEADSEGD